MLWDFGFRHHPDLQTKWIEGSAGLGLVAAMVDKPTDCHSDDLAGAAESFLSETNPELLSRIQSATPAEKEKLAAELRSNLDGILKHLGEK